MKNLNDMKTRKSLSLTLILGVIFMCACQEHENLLPYSTEIQKEKSMPTGYENNPVEQFVGTNPIDPDPNLPPPIPTITPLGKKLKISTIFNTIVMTDHSLVTGKMVTEMNGLWDENMTGPASGEFVITLDDENTWTGMVHGKRHKIDESTWKWTGKYVGIGNGETINGMKIIIQEEIITTELMPNPYLLNPVIQGKIITQ